MARNGSGVFVRVHDWTADADAAINIRADRMDEEFDGMATALTDSIAKDGQTTPSANLPMGTFRHTGVGDASARTHYGVVGQIQDGKYVWIAGGGAADAHTATYAPALTALVDGVTLKFRAGYTNITATPTFSPNGLTARTITRLGGTPLTAGDIKENGEYEVTYNLANTRWELKNPATADSLWVAAGGTADAITATYSPAIPALLDGQICYVRAGAANTSTTPTFSPNGLTARTIVKNGGAALSVGDIKGADHELILRYKLASTRWELLNPGGGAEYGTWTPAISFGGGTTGITYSTQEGRYVKSGRVVTYSLYILLSNKGSSTGVAKITGLPHTIEAGTNTQYSYSQPITAATSLTVSAGNTPLIGTWATGSAATLDVLTTALGTTSQLSNTAFANTTSILASITVITTA